jgi:superfamily I DNA and/or RNA helicase
MGARQEERIACATALLAARRSSQMARLLATHRRGLKRFLDAIRARTSSRQEKLFAEIALPSLTQAFPLWMSTFRDLHRLVPLEKELFDVVIVDEATQSDMASPLPALYRACRAVVTGDPEQLRHVSFLSRARQGALADDHALPEAMRSSLDYRDKSLLDLVDDALESQDQVAFLDEHFRSMPQIIAFSNRTFYGGALRVMTARPETLRERAVEIRNVSGRRDANGVNTVEADALVDELARRIEAQAALGSSLSHTIGVLSPFRDQVEHLTKLVHERLDATAIRETRHRYRDGL